MLKRIAIGSSVLFVLFVLFVLALGFVGCTEGVYDLLEQYQAQHPNTRMKLHDSDGDGNFDTIVNVTENGKPIVGADGNVVEVAGARASFTKKKLENLQHLKAAEDTDALIGEELEFWADIAPPGLAVVLTGVGGFFARRKPLKNAVLWEQNFRDVVGAWEQFRETKTPADWEKVSTNIGKMSEETRKAVAIIRAEIKAAKEAAKTT